jgi:hypothetical protein
VDAFLSHASADAETARRLEAGLQERGLEVWLDESDLTPGAMLRATLQEEIEAADVLVVLWSETSARSRWVNTEWVSALLAQRPVLLCTLGAADVPQCLSGRVWLDVERAGDAAPGRLADAVRAAAGTTTELAPVMRGQVPDELGQMIVGLAQIQQAVTGVLGEGDLERAAQAQQIAEPVMDSALAAWPEDLDIVALHGYHLKNAYMIDHWTAIQAGRSPADARLDAAERRFFEVLWVDPFDPSALNGLGTVLAFQREPRAGERFILAALERAGGDYPAAEADLALVRRFLAR